MHPTYKRMLAGLEKKAKSGDRHSVTACPLTRKKSARKKTATDEWSLYILKCRDGTFYTGITNNLERRLKMHQDGKASRYTRTRGPVEMLYSEGCGDRSSALIRECEVKEWPRAKKEAFALGKEYGVRCTAKKKTRRTNINSIDLPVCSPVRRSA
jgi:putative endonuclease